jgi:hypothetical protein
MNSAVSKSAASVISQSATAISSSVLFNPANIGLVALVLSKIIQAKVQFSWSKAISASSTGNVKSGTALSDKISPVQWKTKSVPSHSTWKAKTAVEAAVSDNSKIDTALVAASPEATSKVGSLNQNNIV